MAVRLNRQGHRSCRQARDNFPAWKRCPAVASLWGVLRAAQGFSEGCPVLLHSHFLPSLVTVPMIETKPALNLPQWLRIFWKVFISQGLQYRFKNDPKIFAAWKLIQRCLKTKAGINESESESEVARSVRLFATPWTQAPPPM